MVAKDFSEKLTPYEQMEALKQAEQAGHTAAETIVKSVHQLGAPSFTIEIGPNPKAEEYSQERYGSGYKGQDKEMHPSGRMVEGVNPFGAPGGTVAKGKPRMHRKYDPTPQDGRITQDDYDFVQAEFAKGNYDTWGKDDPDMTPKVREALAEEGLAPPVPEQPRDRMAEIIEEFGPRSSGISTTTKTETGEGADPWFAPLDMSARGGVVKERPSTEEVPTERTTPEGPAGPDTVVPPLVRGGAPKGETPARGGDIPSEDPAAPVPAPRPIRPPLLPDDAPDNTALVDADEGLNEALAALGEATQQPVIRSIKREGVSFPERAAGTLPEEEAPQFDVEAEEEPATQLRMEAESEDPAPPTVPPQIPEGGGIEGGFTEVVTPPEVSAEITAEEVETLAEEGLTDGLSYLEPIFKNFIAKHEYDPTDAGDRMRMQFLINFFNKKGYPQNPTAIEELGNEAFKELHATLEAGILAESKRLRQALEGDE